MHTIVTLKTRNLEQSQKDGGCFECQTSCQSACKTSCGVANQSCENPLSRNNKLDSNLYVAGLAKNA